MRRLSKAAGAFTCFFTIALALHHIRRRRSPRRVESTKGVEMPLSMDRDHDTSPCAQIIVFYATCSGTAKSLANMLVETLLDRGVDCVTLATHESITDPEALRTMMQRCRLCLGIVATTGDGAVPQEFQRLFAFLRCCTPSQLDDGTHFSILALGDSKYRQFCSAGKEVGKYLQRAGFLPCLSDDGIVCSDANEESSHTRTYGCWVESIIAFLISRLEIPVGPLSASPPIHRRFVVLPEVSSRSTTVIDVEHTPPFAMSPSMMEPTMSRPGQFAVTAVASCVPGGSDHPMVHVTLDVSAFAKLSYEAGDHIGILPPNSSGVVDELLSFLDDGRRDADSVVRILQTTKSAARASPASAFPLSDVTWRFVLTWYVDVSCTPSMQALQHMIRCCGAPENERERMMKLVADVDSYRAVLDSVVHSCRTNENNAPIRLTDVLRLVFPAVRSLSLDRLCEGLPRLQPRYYSIASDPSSHIDGTLEILVRVIEHGITSQYLASRPRFVYGFIRKSTFHLPKGKEKSILMIGPGTGLAPLLGFLHRRSAQMKKQQSRQKTGGASAVAVNGPASGWGPALLFHGCRYRSDWDHHLMGLVLPHIESSALQQLFLCFSREITSSLLGHDRRYVQHLVNDHATEVAALLLDRSSFVFVCGDAKRMARDVRESLEQILCHSGGLTPSSASDHIKRMIASQRYLEDVW